MEVMVVLSQMNCPDMKELVIGCEASHSMITKEKIHQNMVAQKEKVNIRYLGFPIA